MFSKEIKYCAMSHWYLQDISFHCIEYQKIDHLLLFCVPMIKCAKWVDFCHPYLKKLFILSVVPEKTVGHTYENFPSSYVFEWHFYLFNE